MDSGWEKIDKIRIHTKNRHISLNQSMTGIEDMDAYLMRHTDKEKIITKKKHWQENKAAQEIRNL